MQTLETRSATPKQTFALFCATGKDWRTDSRLNFDLASKAIDACKTLRGNKPGAAAIVESILSGGIATLADVLPSIPATPSFEAIYNEAHKAGNDAAMTKVPTPMVVAEHANPLDDNSPVRQAWLVNDGVCGFASVIVRPGTCAFARWLTKEKGARKSYYGGTELWISAFGQSMERKEAYAGAFAAVLNKHGIKAYSTSRMD